MDALRWLIANVEGGSLLIVFFGLLIMVLAYEEIKWYLGVIIIMAYATVSHFLLIYTKGLDTFYIIVLLMVVILVRHSFKENKIVSLISFTTIAISIIYLLDSVANTMGRTDLTTLM